MFSRKKKVNTRPKLNKQKRLLQGSADMDNTINIAKLDNSGEPVQKGHQINTILYLPER